MISTRLYSKPPFCTKKPFGPCTLAIATAIVASTSSPASGVSRPSTNSTPATSSPPTASAAHARAGRNPMLPMKPVAPSNPGPPNAPNAFCAPCARNTVPSVRRSSSNPRSPSIVASSGEHYLEIEILYFYRSGNTTTRFSVPEREMPPPSQQPDTPLKLWVVLARAVDAVDHHSRSSIARVGLGTADFGFVAVLYSKDELAVCDVQRRILVESSSTTYVVDKLVTRGLVRRRHSGTDRRVVLLTLTSAGRRLIQRIFPPHAHAMRRAVTALPPQEQAQAVRLLRTLGLGAAERLEGNERGQSHR